MSHSLQPADYETPELDPPTQRKRFLDAMIGARGEKERKAVQHVMTKLHPELAAELWPDNPPAASMPSESLSDRTHRILLEFAQAHATVGREYEKGRDIECMNIAFRLVRLALVHSKAGRAIFCKDADSAPFPPNFFPDAAVLGKEIDALVFPPEKLADKAATTQGTVATEDAA